VRRRRTEISGSACIGLAYCPGRRARNVLPARFHLSSICIGGSAMAHAKQPSKRKRRRTALPVLGAAGVSLTMAGGASATTTPTANVPSQDATWGPVIVLGEEEISDVSLATFYVFDRENAGTSLGERVQLAQRGCRGCRGCAVRGCAVRGCAGCRGCRACRGCGVGWRACGVGCACGGGCGPCWRWTPAGWIRVC
jgi:hypothetical protein